MLKTFTNLPILTFILGRMRNRWGGYGGLYRHLVQRYSWAILTPNTK